MTDPKARITIPGMHGLDMAVHPMHEQRPMFRLRGSTERESVSIITPKIQEAVSPMACATAVANTVISLSPVTRDQVFLGRSNEHTFLVIYGVPLEHSVLLNTHIVSSDASSQCIEAHVSKVSTSDTDIEPWFNGFGASNIETF